jgi:hypothetical protein
MGVREVFVKGWAEEVIKKVKERRSEREEKEKEEKE